MRAASTIYSIMENAKITGPVSTIASALVLDATFSAFQVKCITGRSSLTELPSLKLIISGQGSIRGSRTQVSLYLKVLQCFQSDTLGPLWTSQCVFLGTQ